MPGPARVVEAVAVAAAGSAINPQREADELFRCQLHGIAPGDSSGLAAVLDPQALVALGWPEMQVASEMLAQCHTDSLAAVSGNNATTPSEGPAG